MGRTGCEHHCGEKRGVDMNELGFYYIDIHKAWLHTPTSSLIFMHELFTRDDEGISLLVFDRTGENPSQWLIDCLKNPLDIEL